MLAPELFADFSKGFYEEINRVAREQEVAIAGARQQLADVERRIAGLVKAIEDGMYAPALKARMAELESEKSRLQAQCDKLPSPEPVRLHPRLPEVYRKQVEDLHVSLNDPLIRDEASESIRGLITKIVLTPSASGVLEAALYGDLAAILQLCDSAATNKYKPKEKRR